MTAAALLYPDDYVRLAGCVLLLLATATFPLSVFRQGRPPSAWFAVAGCELIMTGCAVGFLARLGQPIVFGVWLITAGAFLLTVYCLYVLLWEEGVRRSP